MNAYIDSINTLKKYLTKRHLEDLQLKKQELIDSVINGIKKQIDFYLSNGLPGFGENSLFLSNLDTY